MNFSFEPNCDKFRADAELVIEAQKAIHSEIFIRMLNAVSLDGPNKLPGIPLDANASSTTLGVIYGYELALGRLRRLGIHLGEPPEQVKETYGVNVEAINRGDY